MTLPMSQQHHGLFKGGGHLGEELPLVLGEVVAAGLQGVFPGLAGRAADDQQGGPAPGSGGLHLAVLQGHLLEVAGPVAPEARVGDVLRAPLRVEAGQLLVHGHPGVPEAVHQVDGIGRVHVAAGAVAHVEPIHLHPAKDGHGLLGGEGQGGVVVFQQHSALGAGQAAQGGQAAFHHLLAQDHLPGLLGKLVQYGLVLFLLLLVQSSFLLYPWCAGFDFIIKETGAAVKD